MEDHDPGEQGRRADQGGQGRGGVGESRLVADELQLVSHRGRRRGSVLADEVALEPLGGRQLQAAEEHQGAVRHAQMGFGDRQPQAASLLQIGAEDQGPGERAGDGQASRQRRQE